MTIKLTKSKVRMALLVALCVLAVAFAAVFVLPRGAWADEAAADNAGVTVEADGDEEVDGADEEAAAGDVVETTIEGWKYGDNLSEMTPALRPEQGDVAVYEICKTVSDATSDGVFARFAVKYDEEDLSYYDVKLENDSYVIDEDNPLADDYYSKALARLDAGNYTLKMTEPASADEDEPAVLTLGIVVAPYALPENLSGNTDFTIEVVNPNAPYNGSNNNVPEVLVKFHDVPLVKGVDYELTSDNINAGEAIFNLVGRGNFDGEVKPAGEYKIVKGANRWQSLPNIMQWTYGNYDKAVNLFTAAPVYDYKGFSGLWFRITTDKEGANIAAPALEKITLDDDGYVSDSAAAALSRLGVGTYYLSATVDEHPNYYQLTARGLEFKVFKGVNAWETTPSIKTWTEGEYTSENLPVAKARFGAAFVTIKDINGNIVYNSANAQNTLSSAPAGIYTLTSYVLDAEDYAGMELYTVVFQIYEKPGMPLWGVLLIIFGSLFIVALVIFILWKKGVFQILTGKLMVAISTKATVDATIAAVRANKKNEEARARVEAEKRKQARRQANKQKKEMPLEQQAAALEDKAKKAAARAEKMRARSEAILLRAEQMKERAKEAEEAEAAAEVEAAAAAEQAPTSETPKTEQHVAETPVEAADN